MPLSFSSYEHGSLSLPVDLAIPRWKRALDLVACLIALPALAIATILMAVFVVLFARGPIFFRQERIGYRGRPFTLYKFRTMRADADPSIHQAHFTALMRDGRPMQKMDSVKDVRLIFGGRILRALGIDELPQILNVLRGDMSLVGPRPCIRYEFEGYSAWQRRRFATLPGLTGLWQVSGKNRTTFDEMIRLDIQYGETKSLWLDLKIIALTLPALSTQAMDILISRLGGRIKSPPPAVVRQ